MPVNKTSTPTEPSKPVDVSGSSGTVSIIKKPFNWDWLCVAVFFIVTTVMFSQFIFSDNALMTGSSDEYSELAMKLLTRSSFAEEGQIPGWLSTRLGGMPSLDALFSDAIYPPTMLVRMIMPTHRSIGFMMVIHVFLAGVFFFLMMRRSFGVGRLAAFAGAVFYMLSPQFVSHVFPGHSGKMFVIAWLPYVVWRLRSLMYLPTLRNMCLMAIGIAMMVLSPHVQLTYFVLMGLFLYWAMDIVKTIAAKEGTRRIVFKGAFFWGAVFLGLGIAFIQLWPSYMFVRDAHSVRGIDRGFEFAASWSLHWAEFFSLWIHQFGNALEYYWGKNYFKLNTEYAGMIPLTLTALAFVSKPRSHWRIFWVAIAALSVLFAMGANTPFFTAAYHVIPGVKRFRAPSMIMFWFTFSTALMSVFFIKDLLGGWYNDLGAEAKKRWRTGLMAALGGITLLAVIFSSKSIVTNFATPMMSDMNSAQAAQVFGVNFTEKFVPNLWLWWLFTAASLGMLLAVIYGKLKPAVLVYALIVMSVIDTAGVNGQFVKTESMRSLFVYQNDPELKRLRGEFANAPFRVFPWPGTFRGDNQEGVYGLESVSGRHDNELIYYRAFRADGGFNYLREVAVAGPSGEPDPRMAAFLIRNNTPFLDLANVEYILASAVPGRIGALKNPTNLGRLSYARNYVLPSELPKDTAMKDDNARIVVALQQGLYDYRTTVALFEEPELPFTRGNDDTPAERELAVNWKKYKLNKRVAAVTMPADGFLRISEVYYPGWRIKINGKPTKYYRADVAWMAIPLAAGEYEVTMEPRSMYLDKAMPITLICSALAAAILIAAFIRRKKRA